MARLLESGFLELAACGPFHISVGSTKRRKLFYLYK